MKVADEDISGPFLERAAVEQRAARLEAEGYEVDRDKQEGDLKIDLVARRGDDLVYYEFKLAGAREYDGWAHHLVRLQALARTSGASLKLVMVRPPRQMTIEVDDIEEMLRRELAEHVPSEVADIAGYTKVDDVSGVDLTSIQIDGTEAQVGGEANLGVTLFTGGGETVSSEYFPFSFTATLDLAERTASNVSTSDFDLTSWYGPDEDDVAAEDEDPDGRVANTDDDSPF
jgi:hypothetical protein